MPCLILNATTLKLCSKIELPKPNKPRCLDTLSDVLGDVRVGSKSALTAAKSDFRNGPRSRHYEGQSVQAH